jgi:hypothetical protein
MADQPKLPSSRSQELFRSAPDEIKDLVKKVMAKERQEQHKKNRQSIYQDLLTFVRESAQ